MVPGFREKCLIVQTYTPHWLVPHIHRAPCVHGKVAVCREGRVGQHKVGVCRVFSAPTTSSGFLFTLEVCG